MELLQYWKVIRKSLWIIVLIALVGVSGTAYYTLSRPAEYDSNATLLLNPSVPSALAPYVQTQVAANLADTYTQLMRTRSFADSVVKVLPFPMTADAVPRALTTKLRPNTLFYDITARMGDPVQAQQLASTVVKVFLSSKAAQQQNNTGTASNAAKSDMQLRLQDKLQYLGDQIKSYQADIKAEEAKPASTERDAQLLQLRGQLVSLQQTETETMVGLAQIGDTTAANAALPIDDPLPGVRVSSGLTTNLILALLVSLMIGTGLAFLRDYLDYTVHSPDHLEELMGTTPMAVLGVVSESNGRVSAYGNRGKQRGAESNKPPEKLAGHKLVTVEHPKSPESESFRVLRTNIQFSSLEKPIQSLVVTSAGPGEGKSFTSSNLAVVMAQAGRRVILVDADLRKPNLHKLFDLPNTVGLTNLVVGSSAHAEGAIQPIPGVPNLAVVTSGPLPPNPSELLNSHQAAEVMQMLSKQADTVIYDAPPAGVVTDPLILATRADAVILVVSANTTRRDMVKRVKQSLQNVGVSAVLPVLNRVKARELQGYYYYRYYSENTPEQGSSDGRGQVLSGKTAVRIVSDANE